MATKKNHRLKASEKEAFRRLLLERREVLASDVDRIEDEALNRSQNGNSGELSNVPFHMADVGSENYDREFSLGILQNENEELREIDQALSRLEADTFGLCESCGRRIPSARLKALPYARLCVECKQEDENHTGTRALG